jgi:hypothetical protein
MADKKADKADTYDQRVGKSHAPIKREAGQREQWVSGSQAIAELAEPAG